MRLGLVTSSDPVPTGVSEARRRARAEAARSESVWVRLSPNEATVVGEAARRAGMSVGAWVGETAVGRAGAQARGDGRGEVGGVQPSWRELVAALVALRAEVAAVRRVPCWSSVRLCPQVNCSTTSPPTTIPAARAGTVWSGCCGGSTR